MKREDRFDLSASLPVTATISNPKRIEFEESAVRLFHLRVVLSGSGGQFSDGFVLGIVGITIGSATSRWHLTSMWAGALGAASLGGLLVGAALSGPLTDRIGRRPLFAWDMLIFCALSVLQFFVTSAPQWLVLRLLLGVTLGADYVASKALVMEYCPRRTRGRLLSLLAVAWTLGYGGAYCVGFMLRDVGPDAWRWMLLSSAIPSILVFALRVGVPESPVWLVNRGEGDKAAAIVASRFGEDLAPPRPGAYPSGTQHSRWRMLFSSTWLLRTVVACVFYTCQVIPFFALGTFTARILAAFKVRDSYWGGLIYTLFLLAGAVFGLFLVDKISRRLFLVGSFYISAAMLALLSAWSSIPAMVAVALFSVFAAVLAAATNLEYVYTPELFPTELRASGIGLAVAASRLGAAIGTFVLPLAVQVWGVNLALDGCIIVLLVGAIVCQVWAPETSDVRLASGH